jgi:hypothetical protein
MSTRIKLIVSFFIVLILSLIFYILVFSGFFRIEQISFLNNHLEYRYMRDLTKLASEIEQNMSISNRKIERFIEKVDLSKFSDKQQARNINISEELTLGRELILEIDELKSIKIFNNKRQMVFSTVDSERVRRNNFITFISRDRIEARKDFYDIPEGTNSFIFDNDKSVVILKKNAMVGNQSIGVILFYFSNTFLNNLLRNTRNIDWKNIHFTGNDTLVINKPELIPEDKLFSYSVDESDLKTLVLKDNAGNTIERQYRFFYVPLDSFNVQLCMIVNNEELSLSRQKSIILFIIVAVTLYIFIAFLMTIHKTQFERASEQMTLFSVTLLEEIIKANSREDLEKIKRHISGKKENIVKTIFGRFRKLKTKDKEVLEEQLDLVLKKIEESMQTRFPQTMGGDNLERIEGLLEKFIEKLIEKGGIPTTVVKAIDPPQGPRQVEVEDVDSMDHVDDLDEVEAVDELDEVESVDELDEVESVDELDEVEAVDELDEVESVDELDEVEAVDELDEVESVDELDEVEAVDDLDEVESVDELDEVESVDELDEVEAVDELDEVEAVDELDEVEAVDELDEVEAVDELDEVEAVDELDEVEAVDELDEVEAVDELDEVEAVDELDEVEAVDASTVDDAYLEQFPSALVEDETPLITGESARDEEQRIQDFRSDSAEMDDIPLMEIRPSLEEELFSMSQKEDTFAELETVDESDVDEIEDISSPEEILEALEIEDVPTVPEDFYESAESKDDEFAEVVKDLIVEKTEFQSFLQNTIDRIGFNKMSLLINIKDDNSFIQTYQIGFDSDSIRKIKLDFESVIVQHIYETERVVYVGNMEKTEFLFKNDDFRREFDDTNSLIIYPVKIFGKIRSLIFFGSPEVSKEKLEPLLDVLESNKAMIKKNILKIM